MKQIETAALGNAFLGFIQSTEGKSLIKYLRERGAQIQLGHVRTEDGGWYYGLGGLGFQKWENEETIPFVGGTRKLAHAPRTIPLSAEEFAAIILKNAPFADYYGETVEVLRERHAEMFEEEARRMHREQRSGVWGYVIIGLMILALSLAAMMDILTNPKL